MILKEDIKEILINEHQIKERIQQLAKEISMDYQGKELILVCVLKGAVMFFSDLAKEITIPLTMDFIAVSSYGNSTESSGVVKILKDLDFGVENRNILIVEDIVDTGLTLSYLLENLKSRKPASVKICSLLDKPSRRKVDIDIAYRGFSIADEFVVGYGLDYNENYRNLPFVCILKPEVYQHLS
jgi:hypoxanthine phosphoribosyltransferase